MIAAGWEITSFANFASALAAVHLTSSFDRIVNRSKFEELDLTIRQECERSNERKLGRQRKHFKIF